ncbi:MAG TPA: oligosaccharyl transferase, archaeosortase A system-associated [Candidatus Thermoplasmatota archaeon]|nr:oligosaccharyl transferase, archaeosortase A system-associated [Candidatus Thermoplasmatota archaeon]
MEARVRATEKDDKTPVAGALATAAATLRRPLVVLALELAFLGVLAWLMFDWRMEPFARMVPGTGDVFYVGTDPYYHWRQVLATVAHFPSALVYDPFTQFPLGTTSGQFGTLFDQIAAALAILWGGGQATPESIAVVTVSLPAAMGALTVVPTYYVAKRVAGVPAAVIAAVVLALLPGEFFARSVAGYFDHHVAEVLFSTAAVLGFVVAVDAAARSKLTLVEFVRGGWRLEWPSTLAMLAGGVAMAAYLLVWPAGILFVALLLAYVFLQLLVDHARGRASEDLAIASLAYFLVPFLVTLPRVETWAGVSSGEYTILQPLACAVAAAFAPGLLLLRDRVAFRERWHFPTATLGCGVLLLGLAQLHADLAGNFATGLRWLFSWAFPQVQNLLTIAEVQAASWDYMSGFYGWPLSVAIFVGLPAALVGAALGRRYHLLLFLWGFVMVSAGFSQIRWNYYTAVTVALLLGLAVVAIAQTVGWLQGQLSGPAQRRTSERRARSRKSAASDARPAASAAMLTLAVAALLGAGIVIPAYATQPMLACNSPEYDEWFRTARPRFVSPWLLGCRFSPGDEVLWTVELAWLAQATPPLGIELSDLHGRPQGPFRYKEGDYGVLAWWDYGHWIQVLSKRPPVANPFQQNAPLASRFFTAQSEASAQAVLDDYVRAAGQDPARNPIRYVMIDDEIAAGKFGAIAVWAQVNNPGSACPQGGTAERWFPDCSRDYVLPPDLRERYGAFDTYVREYGLPTPGPRYEQSMLARLYAHDATGLSHYRLVREHGGFTLMGTTLAFHGDGQFEIEGHQLHRILHITDHERMRQDLRDITPPGLDPLNLRTGNAFVAMNQERTRLGYDMHVASRLKTFEHVPGARLQGTAEGHAGETVHAALVLESLDTGRRFLYQHQTTVRADGTFELVVPYSTRDVVPPSEGGTATRIVAAQDQCALRCNYFVYVGSPEFAPKSACLDVPDRAVLRGERIELALAPDGCA